MTAPARKPAPVPVPDPTQDGAPLKRDPNWQGRFRPGVSGNPLGRPRRVSVAPAQRRLITAEPTELEIALGLPVICPAADPEPVSLARAVVARLTERALTYGDVAACRELLRLCAEAEAVRAERELLAAEQAEAEQAADARAAEQAEAAARAVRARAQADALETLDVLAAEAAVDAGASGLSNDLRALELLDAVDHDAKRVTALKPWVVEAARAHDPRLPRGEASRPLDLSNLDDALDRLELDPEDEEGDTGLAAWFIDAARARRPDLKLTPGDEALLQRVRVEDGEAETDWEARLAVVEAMLARTP